MAKRATHKEIRHRKSKSEFSQPFKDRLSTLNFSGNAMSNISSAESNSSMPTNIHGLNHIQFKHPTTTPQTLEAALEIKHGPGTDVMPVVEEIPDFVGDELSITRVPLICFNIRNSFSCYSRPLPVN